MLWFIEVWKRDCFDFVIGLLIFWVNCCTWGLLIVLCEIGERLIYIKFCVFGLDVEIFCSVLRIVLEKLFFWMILLLMLFFGREFCCFEKFLFVIFGLGEVIIFESFLLVFYGNNVKFFWS